MAHMIFIDVEEGDTNTLLQTWPDAVILPAGLPADELIARCADATVISIFITQAFPADIIRQLPKLKLLCTRSVGYDHIDLYACQDAGITVCNVPDYGSYVIAEHAFALLLARMRHISEGDQRTKSGVFDYRGLRGSALNGKTIGIVGTGRIGRAVAKIAHGFDMHILATDICRIPELENNYGVRYVPLDELLSTSDIVSLHVPSLPDTQHMMNTETLSRMKKGSILVNTARGSLIDSTALLEALDSGHIGCALLDVMEHEQSIGEHRALIQHPNVVATPHIAFYADDSMRNMYEDCFESIRSWQKGDVPAHVVKPIEKICDLPGVENKA